MQQHAVLDISSQRRRHRVTLVRIGVMSAVVLLLVLSVSSCSMTLTPPADVQDPVTVFLLDHGRTASLVLPDEHGGMVRYGYGDWQWYALDRTGVIELFPTLFWPTQGALGRLQINGPVSADSIQQQLDVTIRHIYPIDVEREKVRALRESLDAMFHRHRDTHTFRADVAFSFVHHPDQYTLWNNSNRAVAGWLEELGVEVRGVRLWSRWQVVNGD